jgi:hypothetical protein
MAHLIGLFEREGSYYLRVVLHHPPHKSLSQRESCPVSGRMHLQGCPQDLGTPRRAEVLWGSRPLAHAPVGHIQLPPSQSPATVPAEATSSMSIGRCMTARSNQAQSLAMQSRAVVMP